MKRYVLHPGIMVSRNDGDRHYIGIAALIRLYGLRPSDHIVIAGEPGWRPQADDVHLRPRYGGDYPVFA